LQLNISINQVPLLKKRNFNVPLAPAQFGQALFPYRTELNFDFKTIHEILTNWRLELCEIPGQEFCKDTPKVAVK
jgi:hypothetical protein